MKPERLQQAKLTRVPFIHKEKEEMMKTTVKFIGCVFVLAALMVAFAEEVYEPTLYEPFGGYGLEYGEYEPIEGYEAGVDDDIDGNLRVQIAEPTAQAIDVVLVGPDGYHEVLEVEVERLVEGLLPGVYSVAATDDGLQAVIGKVEVAVGQIAPIIVTLNRTVEAGYEPEAFDAYEPYGVYELGPYEGIEATDTGVLTVQVVLSEAAAEAVVEAQVSVVGPNDYRNNFITGATLDGLESGGYAVAATAEGYKMAQGAVEVREGEALTVTFTLEPLNVEE